MEYGIGELAEMSGVTVRTLRWYDRLGLLKPCRVGENGYRYYSSAEADRLQQILLYRALGVELKQIGAILDDPSFNRMDALRGHLDNLKRERARFDGLIRSVERTIQSEERNEIMKDREKFEAFKADAVRKNEETYGAEARGKYGNEAVDASNRMMMNMSPEKYERWQALDGEILSRLEAAVSAGINPTEDEGREIAALHKEWLCCTLDKYTAQMHCGIAQMYTMDERFTKYYDRSFPGCAQFLRDAVLAHIR